MYTYAHAHNLEGFKKASALLFSTPSRSASCTQAAHHSRCLSQDPHLLQLPALLGSKCCALPPHAWCQMLDPQGAPGLILLEVCWGSGGASLTCTLLCSSPLAWTDGNPSLDVCFGVFGVCPHCSSLTSIPVCAPAGRPLGGCFPPCTPQPSAFVVFLFLPFPAAGSFPWELLVGEGR